VVNSPRVSRLQGFWQFRPNLARSLVFVALAMLCLPWLDLEIHRVDPWPELLRIGHGLLTPRWYEWGTLLSALTSTVAFALCAVVPAVMVGVALALFYRFRLVRIVCASVRSVHELFWGLIFMQLFGLSALTGVLAIAVPYSGVFARVFADIFAEQSLLPQQVLQQRGFSLSRWVYTTLAQSWPQLSSYVRYRFECALRSSTILGFIGLPTLGFYFESAFKQGDYSEAACLLWVFYLLIASLRWWLHWRLLPLYFLTALWLLPESPPVSASFLWQFVSSDIWPAALKSGDLAGAAHWYGAEIVNVVAPAGSYTVMLSLVALALTGALVLVLYPFACRLCVGRFAVVGHGVLIFLRSTPELVLAFIFLLLFGPSALPAIVALAVHNGGLIAYLAAREGDQLSLRPDHPRRGNLWAYELTPRLYPRISALLLYRWEVIMRESAILGILGVTTLGFYVDSAFAEIRFDRALLLIVATALLNIMVDGITHRVSHRVRYEEDAMETAEIELCAAR